MYARAICLPVYDCHVGLARLGQVIGPTVVEFSVLVRLIGYTGTHASVCERVVLWPTGRLSVPRARGDQGIMPTPNICIKQTGETILLNR
jgi:hypothetical protein